MARLPEMALSIRQPWVWAILEQGKDIENRGWRTEFRGAICIHASNTMTKQDVLDFEGVFGFDFAIPHLEGLPRGAIVGTMEIVDCVRAHPSKWFFGKWGFVLARARAIDPIPCKGMVSIFEWKPS